MGRSEGGTLPVYGGDITGPMQVKSAGGKEYKSMIVNDYTRVVYT